MLSATLPRPRRSWPTKWCIARLKTHVILDLRIAIYSDLMPYTSMLATIFDTYDCERLGKKALGGLARKARGRA